MTFHVLCRRFAANGASPYRIIANENQEVPWANKFLDAQHARGLSPCSLRGYAYDLLFLARWLSEQSTTLSMLNETLLVDFVLFQLNRKPPPAPRTINHRLTVAQCVYRFHYGREIPTKGTQGERDRTRFGYRRTRRSLHSLRVRLPHHVVVPLTSEEVAHFWSSFRCVRDMSIVALMLFNGLRSREVLHLDLENVRFDQAEIRVQGKGNRERVLPLPEETIRVLQQYLDWERPRTDSPRLFVSLKGRRRGSPMTPAGLRSLFRHHRRQTKVFNANPHRFRHTFGADMVRAGVSLPALMRLMGHAYVQTTMRYVELSPKDVWTEFHHAILKRNPVLGPKQE